MGFDYNYTCPIIDKNIKDAKKIIQEYLNDLISDLSPLIPAGTREELTTSYTENLYSDLEDCFEKVRESNSDMRKAAERQIEDLEDKIENLNTQVCNLLHDVSSLETRLNNLE